jgi:hypothetical protein
MSPSGHLMGEAGLTPSIGSHPHNHRKQLMDTSKTIYARMRMLMVQRYLLNHGVRHCHNAVQNSTHLHVLKHILEANPDQVREVANQADLWLDVEKALDD